MSYLIYDCEILACIGSAGDPGDDPLGLKYRYCKDWRDFANMGISVIGYYSSTSGTGYALQSNLSEFAQLAAQHTDIVGFNSRQFDDCLVAESGIQIATTYDLLEEVRIAAGFEADYQSVPKGYSYTLDAIARANGMAKTGSGSLAPVLWQQGQHQAVIDYCLNDVRLTHELLLLGWAGNLIDPNTQKILQLRAL